MARIFAASILGPVLFLAACGRSLPDQALSPTTASGSQNSAPISGTGTGDIPEGTFEPPNVGIKVTSLDPVVVPTQSAGSTSGEGNEPESPQATVKPTTTTQSTPKSTAGKITVPKSTAESTTTTVASETYIVKEGDTLSGIANKKGITIKQLAAFNGIGDKDSIKPGQKLQIPR